MSVITLDPSIGTPSGPRPRPLPQLPSSKPSHTITSLPLQHTNSRALVRAARQRQLEEEQAREDAAALHMTDEERDILHKCFASVKTEFADLDGLSWSVIPPGLGLTWGTGTSSCCPSLSSEDSYVSCKSCCSESAPELETTSSTDSTLTITEKNFHARCETILPARSRPRRSPIQTYLACSPKATMSPGKRRRAEVDRDWGKAAIRRRASSGHDASGESQRTIRLRARKSFD
ncbi:hypothetical protein DENSPDRAFT_845927 [Dentipellis sp. KUC8613]|nr:hypothetical protein DENSPDRAFT_845927 [Dentipellis sp. KUC8613]